MSTMAEEKSLSLTDDSDSVSSISTICDNENWLEKRPLLSVVCSVIRTNRWHQLGIQLNVDETSLNEIDRDNPSTGLKRTRMFEEWLKTQPNTTNKQLLDALRIIEEDKIAEEYEKRNEINSSLLPTRQSPNFTDLVVKSMIHKMSEENALVAQAHQLQQKYFELLKLIRHFMTQNPKVELIKTFIKSILKMKSLYLSQFVAPYHREIEAITTVDEVFEFLVNKNFIGYLNYQLLEYLSSEMICGEEGNTKIQDKFTEYKKCYDKLIEEPSFAEVIQVFDKYPNISPSTIIGLPIIVVTLTMEWKKRSKKDLEEWLPFLKENRALLQSIGYKCILITYAVFPIDLLNIMDFLNDPNNIKTLKDNGISIETPSHTLETAKLLREDERISSIQLLLQQQFQEISSLKKRLIQEEEQRIADNSYWIAQVTLVRASCIIDQEINTERFKKQEEQFQAAQFHSNQKISDLTNELDTVMSIVQMKDREQRRRTQTPFNKETFDQKKSSLQLEVPIEGLRKKRSYSTDSGFDITDKRASVISTFSAAELPNIIT